MIPTPSRRPRPRRRRLEWPARPSTPGGPGPLPNHSATPQFAKVVEDPYGFDDVPIAKPEPEREFATTTVVDDDDGFPLPRGFAPSSSKPKKKESSGWNEGSGFFDGLPGIVYLIILGTLGFSFLLSLVSPSIGAYVFLGTGALSRFCPLSLRFRRHRHSSVQ